MGKLAAIAMLGLMAVLASVETAAMPARAVAMDPAPLAQLSDRTASPHAPAAGQLAPRPLFLPYLSVTRREPRYDIIGQIGGTMTAVVADGERLVVGLGPRLAVFDLDEAAAPRLLGQTDVLPIVVESLALSGGLAYVGCGGCSGETLVVDVSVPSALRVVGRADIWHATGLGVAGQLLLGSAGSALVTLDRTDPIAPRRLGSYTDDWLQESGSPRLATMLGDVLLGSNNRVQRMDLSDPAHPVPVGEIRGLGLLTTDGAHAYLSPTTARVTSAGIAIWRFDRDGQQEVGRVTVCGFVTVAAVAAGRLYAFCEPEDFGPVRLVVVDVRQPEHPVTLASADLGFASVKGLAVSKQHLYVVGRDGLVVVDVQHSAVPRIVWRLDVPQSVRRIALNGDTLLAADPMGRRLWAVDIADPARPGLGPQVPSPGEVERLAVADGRGYAGGNYNRREDPRGGFVAIYDLERPWQESLRGLAQFDDAVWDLAPSGRHVYVGASGRGGLRVLDVSAPEAPVEVARTGISGHLMDLALAGDTLATVDAGNGLRLVDVADPVHPRLLGRLPLDGVLAVAARGNTAYVGQWKWVTAVDVGDPTRPTARGEVGIAAFANERVLFLNGSWLYALNVFSVGVADVTDAQHPVYAAEIGVPGFPSDLVVHRGDLFLAAGSAGLVVLRPAAP